MLESEKQKNQLLGLERHTRRGHHEKVDHAAGGHDDLSNSLAGAAIHTQKKRQLSNAELKSRLPLRSNKRTLKVRKVLSEIKVPESARKELDDFMGRNKIIGD